MNDEIKFIFKENIYLLNQIEKSIYYFRTQNYDLALRLIKVIISKISKWIDIVISESGYFYEDEGDFNNLISTISSLYQAQENKDYILLADLYEGQLIPILLNLQFIIINEEGLIFDQEMYSRNMGILKDRNVVKGYYESIEGLLEHIDEGYSIEYTTTGQYTMAKAKDNYKYYLHSNNCVSKEAFHLAKSWYSVEKTNYIVYGLGLGYHVCELLEIDKNIKIEVFESDGNIIQLSCAFSNNQIFNNPNITLIYDPEFVKLSERMSKISDHEEFVIHYPSLRSIKNISARENLENYFLQYSSIKNQLHLLHGNFRKNIFNYTGLVDDLVSLFQGKNLYIIAAGPSLDKNFLKLKEITSDSIVMATGTVLKKLLNAGIRPDYFIVTDANERVYAQISGLEQENIPMLYLSTAYYGFAENYQGSKYMILQKDYDKSEQFAKEKDAILFRTGGSVSTTALDVGITLGCKRIIFLGLDLAFTDNYVHALGTSRRDLSSTDDLRQVEDIHGNMIYTSKSLDIYREWIENRIKTVNNIEFINATEGGAKVKGMKISSLHDMISE